MATSVRDVLKQDVLQQQQRAPMSADAFPYLTRYIFVPFLDKPLTLDYQQSFGLPLLRQGIIQRIARFDMEDQDFDAMNRVPQDEQGRYRTVGYGSPSIRRERRPMDVVSGIMYNHNSGQAGNNGLREIVSLRGMDDFAVQEELQMTLLPEIYDTLRAQVAQLASAIGFKVRRNPLTETSALLADVRESAHASSLLHRVGFELLEATIIGGGLWAQSRYRNLVTAIEKAGRNHPDGRDELVDTDLIICRWLEAPVPKLQSLIEVGGQPQTTIIQQAPSRPVRACPDCGNDIKLLEDGSLPRRGCIVCGWNPNKPETQLLTSDFDPDKPMGEGVTDETEAQKSARQLRLEKRQAEMKNGK